MKIIKGWGVSFHYWKKQD